MTEELKDTSSLKNSITQQSDSNESIEQALEDSENRRKEEGGFGVEKPISVIFAAIEGFEVDSNADMDMIEEISIVMKIFLHKSKVQCINTPVGAHLCAIPSN